jgi:hypothetical protein
MHEPDVENVYSIIGFTLTCLQSFERSIKFCATYVLQGEDELNWERLQKIEKEEGKKALGHFIAKVRARAALHQKFEELLTSVLRDRNDFVHNTDRIAGWNLSTYEGVEVAKGFCLSLLRRTHLLQEILSALCGQWQQQARIEVSTTPEQDEYFAQIDSKYGHLVDLYFARREA